MMRKELTMICMMIANFKNSLVSMVYIQIFQRFKGSTLFADSDCVSKMC